MADERDIADLVRRVTAEVKARLEQPVRAAETRPARLVVLLPVWTAALDALAAQVEPLRRHGMACTALAPRAVLDEITRSGRAGVFGREITPLEETGLGALLADLRRGDAVVVGSLGFAAARRLARTDDDDPAVRLITQALLKGVSVAALTDDLAAGKGVPKNRLAAEVRAVLRDLEGLGIDLVALDGLSGWMGRAAALDAKPPDAFDGLVTEDDVKRMAANGRRRLVIGKGTIVTPLAQSAAIGFGMTIVRED